MTTILTHPGARALLDPFTPLGHTAAGPVFPAAGGRGGGVEMIVDDRDDDSDPFDSGDEDDEDDDRDERDDDEEDDEEPRGRQRQRQSRGRRADPDDTDGWTPPTRERWERTVDQLGRANAEAAKRRVWGKKLEKLGVKDANQIDDWLLDRGIDPTTGERIADDGEPDATSGADDKAIEEQPATKRTRAQTVAEQRRHEERGAARVEEQYKPAVALFAAELALKDAGFTGSNVARALKIIYDPDLIDVEFGDDGWPIVTGLDEQIEALRNDIPEWFQERDRGNGGRRPAARDDEDDDEEPRRPARRRRTGAREVDGGERGRPPAKAKGWKELLNDRIVRGH